MYEIQKSDTTRSGIAQNLSMCTQTPHFNTPPRREFLIHHLTTTTMPQVKARAAKNEKREEKIHWALEERAQFGTSFEDLHHKYGIPKSTLCNRAEGEKSHQKAHEVYQPEARLLTHPFGIVLNESSCIASTVGYHHGSRYCL